MTGSVDALKSWSPDNAIALTDDNYPTWTGKLVYLVAWDIDELTNSVIIVTVSVPANTIIEYKFIRKFNGAVTWESDPNRVINTPGPGSFIENDTWR